MSAHLFVFAHADITISDRQGHSIIYCTILSTLNKAPLFLPKDCCDGQLEICAPLIVDLSPCCTPSE